MGARVIIYSTRGALRLNCHQKKFGERSVKVRAFFFGMIGLAAHAEGIIGLPGPEASFEETFQVTNVFCIKVRLFCAVANYSFEPIE